MTQEPLISAAEMNELLGRTIPMLAKIGIELTVVERDRAASRIPIEGNGNHFGVMYAGSLYCVAECLAGSIGFANFDGAKYFPLVKTSTIRFLRPATTDISASTSLDAATLDRMATDLEANGKADFTLDVEMVDTNGQVVATMSSECQVRAHK